MNKLKRAVHFDFHTMPGIKNLGSQFDALKFAKTLKDANVEYINMFARCNIGFSYYDTKIGIKYPTLKSNMLKDCIDECHKYGIGVTAYLNGGLNHELCLRHPEFMKINKNGEVMSGDRVYNNFFRMPCFNTGYREYLLSEISEILELNPDGVFCDCLVPRSCYCPKCIEKMKSKNIDITDDDAVFKFAYDTMIGVFEDIRAIVPKDKRLFLNSFPYENISKLVSHVELECLPTDACEWGYDYFGVEAPYYRNFSDDRIYMTGKFLGSWGEFGGCKSKASLEYDMYDAIMNGYGISIGDHLNPNGLLDNELYSIIKDSFAYAKSLEKWTEKSKILAEACIIRNKTTYKNARTPINNSDRGAARILSELKICYDIKNEDMDLSDYKLIVLPDNIEMTDKLCDKLEKFDGSVLSSGSSIRAGGRWNFVDIIGEDTHTLAYYKEGGQEVKNAFCPGILMNSSKSLADYIEPYFDKIWDGRHGYFYTPPKDEPSYCAIASDGKTTHICFNIFNAYFSVGAVFLKKTVDNLINKILPCRLLQTNELPSGSRATLAECSNGKLLFIKTTYPEHRGQKGIIEENISMPSGRKIVISGVYNSVVLLPDMTKTDSTVIGNKTEITLPEICGFAAFLLN